MVRIISSDWQCLFRRHGLYSRGIDLGKTSETSAVAADGMDLLGHSSMSYLVAWKRYIRNLL